MRDYTRCRTSFRTSLLIQHTSIPLVAAFIVLFYLHRRHVKKVKREDQDDDADLDFGLGDKPSAASRMRKSIFGEKNGAHKTQLSMDMNMSTPYLLPPQTHESSETLHTLAHSVQTPEDRYKPVDHLGGSDVGSIRSARRGPGGDQASLYSARTRDMRSPTVTSFPCPPPAAADPYRHNSPSSPQPPISRSDSYLTSPTESTADPFMGPSEGQEPRQHAAFSGDGRPAAQLPKIDIPSSTMPPTIDIALSPQERESPTSASAAQPMTAKIETAEITDSLPVHPEPQQAQMGDVRDRTSSRTGFTSPPLSPPPRSTARQDAPPQVEIASAHDSIYSDYNQPQSYQHNNDDCDDEPRGRPRSRFPDEAPRASQLLAAPQTENKRLSVGFRPLPPDEIMDTEDPEHRANRIRSFYKEYFEVDSSQSQPPLPGPVPAVLAQPQAPSPQQPQPQPQAQPAPQSKADDYYEDYDGVYLENTYVDPGSKSFVIPYAQPVHRRAMTPPPARGPRMRGPPPPRVMHGSMGGISLQGSHFRPGSATSSRLGPRPDSSASARIGPRGRPRPPAAPPAPLTTLPNPAKLGDDTFALMSASDFAPPDSFKERARGRSQSPVPEKRPYHLGVPIASPLTSSYDDLAAIPSP